MSKPIAKKKTNKERDREIAELQAGVEVMKRMRLPSIDRTVASLFLHLGLDVKTIVEEQNEAYNELLKKAQEEMEKRAKEAREKTEEK